MIKLWWCNPLWCNPQVELLPVVVVILGCIWSLHKGDLIEKWSRENIRGGWVGHVSFKRSLGSSQIRRGWWVGS